MDNDPDRPPPPPRSLAGSSGVGAFAKEFHLREPEAASAWARDKTERQRDLAINFFLAKPYWTLAETLAWIVFRDGAAIFDYCATHHFETHADYVNCVQAEASRLPISAEQEPYAALHVAGLEGRVTAFASFPFGYDGRRVERPIEAHEWGDPEIVWVVGCERPDLATGRNTRFDRATAMLAFPSVATLKSSSETEASRPSTRPQPKKAAAWARENKHRAIARLTAEAASTPFSGVQLAAACAQIWEEEEGWAHRKPETFREGLTGLQ